MSLVAGGICREIQTQLEEHSINPLGVRSRTGMINALLSAENRAGFSNISYQPEPGKNAVSVWMDFWQRDDGSNISETELEDYCSTEPAVTKKRAIYTISDHIYDGFDVSLAEMRAFCEQDVSDNVTNGILSKLNSLVNRIEYNLNVQARLGAGKYVDGSIYKDFRFLSTNSDYVTFPANGESALLGEFWEMGSLMGNQTPIVVGGRKLEDYAKVLGQSCCNAQGVDYSISSFGDTYKYASQRINSAFSGTGANDPFIAFLPGAMHLAEAPRNAGPDNVYEELGSNGLPSIVRGTLVDPMTGLTFDLSITRVECPDIKWHVKISKMYGLWIYPLAFGTSDPLAEVNFVVTGDLCGATPTDIGCASAE